MSSPAIFFRSVSRLTHLRFARVGELLKPINATVCRVLVTTCFFLLLAPCLPAATPAPDDLVSPAHRLDPVQPAPPWDALLNKLRQKGDILATFTENRYLPFKKIPVVFTGEIRFSHDHGLSLHYSKPEDQLMVMDDRGVFMRNAAGRTREGPSDPRALSATGALLHVMRFDLSELSKQFDAYAAGDTANWHFAFEPKEDALSHTLSRLVVSGEGEQVKRIVMRKSALQSVEILIGETRENVTFTAEELQRYFR